MSEVFVRGCGAVSPGGWGVAALVETLAQGKPLPTKEIAQPGWPHSLCARAVPPPSPRPAFLGHARLRRSSPIAQYGAAAALEALGPDAAKLNPASSKLGIIFCAMAGCVNYSRRFFDETLKDPATASPLVFPETVFNAPASHLAALLGTPAINYTLLGDPGTFLQALALAGDWLQTGRVEGCLVVGSEELDWLVAEGLHLFDPTAVVSDGAGALYLGLETERHPAVSLTAVTDAYQFSRSQPRGLAAARARLEIGPGAAAALLCDGCQGVPRMDRDEATAWTDWPGHRLSPKRVFGEGFMAAAAWQCVAAIDLLWRESCPTATVSVVGCNQQAIAARFDKNAPRPSGAAFPSPSRVFPNGGGAPDATGESPTPLSP